MKDYLQVIAEKIARAYGELRQAARTFDDAQRLRINMANRLSHINPESEVLRALAAGTDEETPVTGYDVLDSQVIVEKRARRWIEQVYRAVAPARVIEWQEATPGVTAYQLGRLLGEAGHPRLALPFAQIDNPDFDPEQPQSAANERRLAMPLEARLRTLAQWRQRCGYGRPGRIPKGATQSDVLGFGLPRAKTIVYLMMGGMGGAKFQNGKPDKTGRSRGEESPYHAVYVAEKAKYAERAHTGPCSGGFVSAGGKIVFAKCKIDAAGNVVSGSKFDHYADAGDPFSPAHLDSIGVRHAGKQMLADLYDAAFEDWCV